MDQTPEPEGNGEPETEPEATGEAGLNLQEARTGQGSGK